AGAELATGGRRRARTAPGPPGGPVERLAPADTLAGHPRRLGPRGPVDLLSRGGPRRGRAAPDGRSRVDGLRGADPGAARDLLRPRRQPPVSLPRERVAGSLRAASRRRVLLAPLARVLPRLRAAGRGPVPAPVPVPGQDAPADSRAALPGRRGPRVPGD